jgi:Fusaric acid resistance protein family
LADTTDDDNERARQMTFVLVGAGPTGVELAASMAQLAAVTVRGQYRRIDPARSSIVLIEGGKRILPTLADCSAIALIGIRRALDGLLLLANPARAVRGPRSVRLRVPDLLPALANAVRAFVIIGAVGLFWVTTAWPSGAQAITFAAITVILFSPRADQAYIASMSFMVGTGLTTAFAAIVKFALLPGAIDGDQRITWWSPQMSRRPGLF